MHEGWQKPCITNSELVAESMEAKGFAWQANNVQNDFSAVTALTYFLLSEDSCNLFKFWTRPTGIMDTSQLVIVEQKKTGKE